MDSIENCWWHKLVRRFAVLLATKMALVILLAYEAGFYFSQLFHFAYPVIGGLWCAVSGVVVLQVLIEESFAEAYLRILGSFVGAVTSCIFSEWMGYTLPALLLCVWITAMLCAAFNIKHSMRLASLTATIIIVIGFIEPTVSPVVNAFARFIESAMGSGIAVVLTMLFYPLRKKLHFLGH